MKNDLAPPIERVLLQVQLIPGNLLTTGWFFWGGGENSCAVRTLTRSTATPRLRGGDTYTDTGGCRQ